jgi:aspartate aminotransferase
MLHPTAHTHTCTGYAMTGYRVGWTRCAPALAAQLTKLQEPLVSCASSFSQLAACAALTGPQTCVRDMRAQYRARRDAALRTLRERGRESAYSPGGAFYLPVDISSSGTPHRVVVLLCCRCC